jgi:hypothetical protein
VVVDEQQSVDLGSWRFDAPRMYCMRFVVPLLDGWLGIRERDLQYRITGSVERGMIEAGMSSYTS